MPLKLRSRNESTKIGGMKRERNGDNTHMYVCLRFTQKGEVDERGSQGRGSENPIARRKMYKSSHGRNV